jgi:hypothetical protein
MSNVWGGKVFGPQRHDIPTESLVLVVQKLAAVTVSIWLCEIKNSNNNNY